MAPQKKANGTTRAKLTKANPDFFRIIGSKGGKATKKAQPKGYFSKIAVLSHRDRERSTSPAQPETESDSIAGTRDKAKRKR
jgi:hypothetical protein